MSTSTTFLESNKKSLSELYFKAVAEKEVLRRIIRNPEVNESDLLEYTQLDNLISNLRSILGTVILTVP